MVKCNLTFDIRPEASYSKMMDLLKRSELPAWLLKKFGSASNLAAALNVTRQTAHNLITGRTIPSYETCERLGLDPAFLLTEKEKTRTMSSLDDFLSKRDLVRRQQSLGAEAELARARLLAEHSTEMLEALKEATRATAIRVGTVDGKPFEWNPYPFLKLEHVAATFTPGMLAGGALQGCRVVFGRIPTAMYIDDNPLAPLVWDLALSVNGNELTWDVNGDEIIGASSVELAEQIVKQLVEYRDGYQTACSEGWLT
jgi:hypothetical protein